MVMCFPRLYAAASLKPPAQMAALGPRTPFSAALCRGLIEAWVAGAARYGTCAVFRGFMPRPH